MEYKGPFHGFLTEADRAYLQGQKNLAGEAERGTRSRIRKRTLNGLLDCKLLFEALAPADWELLFDEPDRTDPQRDQTAMRKRAALVVAFLYRGIQDHAAYDFEEVLTEGIRRAEHARDRDVHHVDLDVQYVESIGEEVRRKLETGDRLTDEERRTLLQKLKVVEGLQAAREMQDFDIGPAAQPDNNAE